MANFNVLLESIRVGKSMKKSRNLRSLKESLEWRRYSQDKLDEINEEIGAEEGDDGYVDSYRYIYLPSSKGKIEFGLRRETYDEEPSNDLYVTVGGDYEDVPLDLIIKTFGLDSRGITSLIGDYADIAENEIIDYIDDLKQEEVDDLLRNLGYNI